MKKIWNKIAIGRVAIHYLLLLVILVIALFTMPLSETWFVWLFVIFAFIMTTPTKKEKEFKEKKEKFFSDLENTPEYDKVDVAITRIRLDGNELFAPQSNKRIYIEFAKFNVPRNNFSFEFAVLGANGLLKKIKFKDVDLSHSSGINLFFSHDSNHLEKETIYKVELLNVYQDDNKISFKIME
ncbi:MAG: hypothetical protein IKX00_00210 [Bacilli bacterium]|nr:hypothetical protein [Bacilli bacterium]